MSQIKINNLSFTYEGSYDAIFENVSFQMDTRWKLGFTGRNGRGKTTFFKLLMGVYPYSGSIQASVHFDYFPYEVSGAERHTRVVLQEIAPDIEEWELLKEFGNIDLPEEVLDRPFETMSHGEQSKALLAVLFLKSNNFLLIDEPTNHLDVDARETVANYLRRKSGFIIVSHDRIFLDGIIDHILSINKTNIEIQKGNFSTWLQNKAYQDQFEVAENEKLLKDIKRLGDAAKRTAGWSDQTEISKFGPDVPDRGFVGHKAAKMMKRAKVIERRRDKALEDKKKLLKNLEVADSLEIVTAPVIPHPYLTLEIETLAYDDFIVLEDLAFKLESSDRVAICGKNGSGKSSLLKAIIKQTQPELLEASLENLMMRGRIKLANGLILSYVSQDTSFLTGSYEAFAEERGIERHLLRSMLDKLDFTPVLFEKDLSQLSEGQKKKVLLASSICQRAHLYIWDEPLNFIDVLSRVQIEEMILTYEPTLLFIEHDPHFVDRIATHIISLD
ncbi:MAG: ABC-F type ribosomal protection protein [Firmicutes bacterium]|nr:ABC-F type ribosomal protection protein [Bacillota bacterium]